MANDMNEAIMYVTTDDGKVVEFKGVLKMEAQIEPDESPRVDFYPQGSLEMSLNRAIDWMKLLMLKKKGRRAKSYQGSLKN